MSGLSAAGHVSTSGVLEHLQVPTGADRLCGYQVLSHSAMTT